MQIGANGICNIGYRRNNRSDHGSDTIYDPRNDIFAPSKCLRCKPGNIGLCCFKARYDHVLHIGDTSGTQAESDDDKTIDIAGPSESEADILTRIMLEDLIEYLGTFEGKRYDTIFQMLYDQCGTQEIADELGVAWSTAKDAVKKVRQLAQEHTGLTRN